MTVAEDSTAEEFMDFYLDDDTRTKWVSVFPPTRACPLLHNRALATFLLSVREALRALLTALHTSTVWRLWRIAQMWWMVGG